MSTTTLPAGRWIAACSAAEAIGMTAAASAARFADTAATPVIGLTLIVAGGLIEGLALGILQAIVLSRALPGFKPAAWITATAVIAGFGWAAASASSQLSGSGGDAPTIGWTIAGAAALGAAMGALLGAAQAVVLRNVVPRSTRWIAISAIAWTPAMVVTFVGATTPDVTWATGAVIVLGAGTGALAGALLGAISSLLWPWVVGTSVANRATLGLLASRGHPMLDGALVGLRVRGRRTGILREFPVQYAACEEGLAIYPSNAPRKLWWRNLRGSAELEVLADGQWQAARGFVVHEQDALWRTGSDAYRRRWGIRIPAGAPLVMVQPLHAPLETSSRSKGL